LNALAAWALGAKLLFSPVAARWFMSAATVGFLVYAVSVTLGAEAFGVAAVMAVMATIFLLSALVIVYWHRRTPRSLVAACGLALTLLAILVQQLGIGLDPRYFNHNAVAHVVQAFALALLFMGGLWLLESLAVA
jgi:hypothetical protein